MYGWHVHGRIKLIQLDHITKTFDTGAEKVHAVSDVTLHIRSGEIFGIIGFSGAGKSTLVRCINLLERPTSGTVAVDGKVLTDLPAKELREARKKIGMIFQHFNLMRSRTVGENVAYPLKGSGLSKAQIKAKVRELLELVDIAEKENAYPSQLSGGQKQRVAIARALANDPKVLLCDEATSALDPNTTKSILELLKKINRELGITVIVITHEMAVIESICDRVAIIDHSHIAESGKVSEIFSGPKSEIGRQLILGETVGQKTSFARARQIRVIFNGQESSEPIISNMVLACKAPVNILLADTHDIGGKAMGQMLLQLPEDEVDAGRICNYLKTVGVTYEEVR